MTDAPTPTAPETDELAVYLIRKHGLWYRPDERGYTSSATQAGRYTIADAEKITHPNGKDGPRDCMDYVHEDAVNDADWLVVRAIRAEVATLRASEARLREALEPSGDTKAAYMGEIKDPETKRMVSWTAIKMVMAMISARASIKE